jgi:hypothetical protein
VKKVKIFQSQTHQFSTLMKKNFLIDTDALEEMLESTSFIIGPLSNDGAWERNRGNLYWPEPLKETWYQLCITDKKLARKFNLALHKIAFIRKEKGLGKHLTVPRHSA